MIADESTTERESRLAINDRETKVGTEGSSSSSAARRGTERERVDIGMVVVTIGGGDRG